jgi:hypothetical protein
MEIRGTVSCIAAMAWLSVLVTLPAAQDIPAHTQPGTEGSPWFSFSTSPIFQPETAPPAGNPFENHQLPERPGPEMLLGDDSSPGGYPLPDGVEPFSNPASWRRSAVPPNAAEVLPELDFRQFPTVPRAPIPEPLRVRSYKDGFFQKLSMTGTYLDRGASRSVGVTELEMFSSFAVPWPSRQQPLIITPGFNTRFLEGPDFTGIPNTVYDAYLQTMWLPQWSDHWGGVLGVTTGVYSDFGKVTDEAIRVSGRALLRWDVRPDELQWVAGILYLNRRDIRILPAVGLIWAPEDHVRHEIIFPRPKFAWRLGFEPGQWDDWFYLGGEFGGDSWLVERHDELDQMTMRDWRLIMGFERKRDGGGGVRAEVGYVFARTFEFERAGYEYRPDDTVMLRLGGAF